MEVGINLLLHLGGQFVSETHMEYVGGEVDVWPDIDIDKFSITELEWFGKVAASVEVEAGFDLDVELAVATYFSDWDGEDDLDGAYIPEAEDNVDEDQSDQAGGAFKSLEDIAGSSRNFTNSSGHKRKWRVYNASVNNSREYEAEEVERVQEIREEVAAQIQQEQGYFSEEFESLKGSDDEEDDKPPEFYLQAPYGQVHLEVEMLFPNLSVFKNAIKDYNIAIGRFVRAIKNDKIRCRFVCEDGCEWVAYCAWTEEYGAYQMKTFNPNHTCSRKLKNKLADRNWIANKLVEMLSLCPNMTGGDAFKQIGKTFQIQVNEMKIYRALKIAKQMVEGSEKEQFAKLWDYCEELRKTNPSSTFQLGVVRTDLSFPPVFDRLYIGFDATKKGMLAGCRPLIGLDGCFLKGYYGGTILAAVTQDGNQSFYVIAYAVVEQETKNTWGWFLRRLFEDIGDPKTQGWEFISDMQKKFEPDTWSMAAFSPFTKNPCLLNNMCEQFNAAIVKFRGKPILSMLEEIRLYLMRKMNDSRSMIAKYKGPITPAAQMRGEDLWDKSGHEVILPPKYSRGGGRPKKKRTKSNDVPTNPFKAKRGGEQKCGKCGNKGHNSRRCKGTKIKEQKKSTKKAGPSTSIDQAAPSCPASTYPRSSTPLVITASTDPSNKDKVPRESQAVDPKQMLPQHAKLVPTSYTWKGQPASPKKV
ncbi:hypothetical protein CRG98_028813 [Punica granatum]|uniref:CCHC-type domain-containing protein n=1 Tax=Punica granatum TaxID=22663 RepID=A0A2I0J3K3_PUNGR|nr:hypothetical protein CRG98_028813 [Punica granatum]